MGNGRTCFEDPSINEAYFFSGSRYCRVKYTPDTNVEEITYGRCPWWVWLGVWDGEGVVSLFGLVCLKCLLVKEG